jgi:raffinose/stachyose/melibiose transport system substrate-binding protein
MVRSWRLAFAVLAGAFFAPGVGASQARPAGGDAITISMVAFSTNQPAFQILIPNFERVYPNITVNATYAASATAVPLEATELAAGTAPDLITTFPGCGTPASVCQLAKAGDLAPLVNVPWAKRSPALVTSISKFGKALYVFEPQIAPWGVFTNDALFAKLGLKVPQTFSRLLAVCRKAKNAGTSALIFDGGMGPDVGMLIRALALPTVYAADKHWTAELRAGTVTFDGSAGWRQALQEFVDMNNAGCFQPGVTGTTPAGAEAEFAAGQGLMLVNYSGIKGAIDVLQPQFGYSFAPFPGGTSPGQATTLLHTSSGLSINAHSTAQAQAAALAFINFIARPKQNALYTQVTGGVTSYQFLKGQIPSFMSGFAPVFAQGRYVPDPSASWSNANVVTPLTQAIGLITGQASIDDILNAMDAAWKQAPD